MSFWDSGGIAGSDTGWLNWVHVVGIGPDTVDVWVAVIGIVMNLSWTTASESFQISTVIKSSSEVMLGFNGQTPATLNSLIHLFYFNHRWTCIFKYATYWRFISFFLLSLMLCFNRANKCLIQRLHPMWCVLEAIPTNEYDSVYSTHKQLNVHRWDKSPATLIALNNVVFPDSQLLIELIFSTL